MTSRDDFVAQLIAALKENEQHAGESVGADAFPTTGRAKDVPAPFFSATSQRGDARAAYDALQFDFPVVDESQLLALADKYRLLAQGGAGVADARQFALTAKLVENIEYLNDSTNKRRGTEASSLLAAAILLLVPRSSVAHPENDIGNALMESLRVPVLRQEADETTLASKIEQFNLNAPARREQEDEEFNGGFVEVYAAEEDPDDLSLVYEGDVPVFRDSQHSVSTSISKLDAVRRSHQLHFLASKTYSTCFSLISSENWSEWKIDAALCDLAMGLLEHDAATEDDKRVFGIDGEWQRYIFVFRDQLLRFSDSSDVCTSGLSKLKGLVIQTAPDAAPNSTTNDPFFSFSKPTAHEITDNASAQRTRLVFRVFAELAVSKEFNSLSARQSQHSLAVTIQQLFPTVQRELQTLSNLVSKPDFEADHSDFVIVLLQLLHFVVDASGASPASHRVTIDKLHDSGLLRVWHGFLPSSESSFSWPWLAPLFRLFGESALWNADFAGYVHRVPKISKILQAAQEDATLFTSEVLLLVIAGHQQNIAMPAYPADWLWSRFRSESVFPAACGSFLESMQKMADTLFLLDALAKAVSTLPSQVADELRSSLQSIYSVRFSTAFEYPNFSVPSAVDDSLNKDEPEPPPSDGVEEKIDEEEERGRAEALQFIALRNKLRQCAKSILLSQMTSLSSSKLD